MASDANEPAEAVLFAGHPSWRSVLDFYAKGLVLVALAAALAAVVTRVTGDSVNVAVTAGAAAVVAVAVLVAGFLKRASTTYEITEARLRINRGLLSRTHQECRLGRVQNVTTRQSVIERILRVGTVDFDTAGAAGADFAFVGVSNPEAVVRKVDDAQRAAETAPAAPPTHP